MSEERDEADEISCDVEQWLIFGVKGFRTVNEAVDTIEARIRAYGDSRERAGIERATSLLRLWSIPALAERKADLRNLANEIEAVCASVPAPVSQEPER